MSEKAGRLADNGWCFACGKKNPHGLGMKVRFDEDAQTAFCGLSLPPRFQGWEGIAHGGVVATMLDEIMAHAVIHFVGQAVTGSMESRYRAPVPLETGLMVRGWVTGRRGPMAEAQAVVEPASGGKPLAEAKARFLLTGRQR